MKKITILFTAIISLNLSLNSQIIDHTCIDLENIPKNYIDSAKSKLHIGYGHTSHGSQLISGMNALESYYTEGTYNWSHSGGENELHLYEGDGYGDGDLDHDIGYTGWDDETREYLDSNPQCNVILWSWCGQVNDVDLQTHLFDNMEQLETEYPGVTFIYMTGHLEGKGPEGTLFAANQQIREYCSQNNKFLFDFADIEKYDPDATQNYMNYYANDKCLYDPDGEEPVNQSENWATNWLDANPDHELKKISDGCGSCAHSVSLNCVKKGIAAWFLWAQLVGWKPNNPTGYHTAFMDGKTELECKVSYNPIVNTLDVSFYTDDTAPISVSIFSITGKEIYTRQLNDITIGKNEFKIPIEIPRGIYIVRINNKSASESKKIYY